MEGCTSIDTFGDYDASGVSSSVHAEGRGQGGGTVGCIIRADTKHRCWIPLDWKEKTMKQEAFIRSKRRT